MAKNDDKRARTRVDEEGIKAQDQINLANSNMLPQNQQKQNLFTQSANQQVQHDYGDIMGQYKNFAANAPAQVTPQNVSYNRSGDIQNAISGYTNFANTGGYSQEDQDNLRARGVAPIRAVYANMMNEMMRQKNLSGGYSPNFNAAATKMRTGTSQQMADHVTNVNAGLADAIRQGKLAGLGGLGQVSLADADMAQKALLANQRAGIDAAAINNSANNMQLNAIRGQADLFGTRPGLTETTGQLVGQSNDQMLEIPRLQNQLGLGLIQGQINAGQLPGQWESNIGRIKDVANIGGSVLGAM